MLQEGASFSFKLFKELLPVELMVKSSHHQCKCRLVQMKRSGGMYFHTEDMAVERKYEAVGLQKDFFWMLCSYYLLFDLPEL